MTDADGPSGAILMSPRSLPPVPARHPWPEGTFLQGGDKGVVFVSDGTSYGTAFVEAHSGAHGFIRGEGATIADAEDDAWTKATRALECPGHEYEARHYKNGGGLCKHCGRFRSDVFTPTDLGLFCAACGEPTFWHRENREPVGEFFICPLHTPHIDPDWLCTCTTCMQSRKDRGDAR